MVYVQTKATLRDRLDAMANRPDTDKGSEFEEWLAATLPRLPMMEMATVHLWRDAPLKMRRKCLPEAVAKSNQDPSIDLLAVRHDGGIIAIQAKCHAPDKELQVNPDRLGNFWTATSGEDVQLAGKMIITTGGLGGPKVERLAKQHKCSLISAQADWGDLTEDDLRRRAPLKLDPQQQEACDKCVRRFKNKDESGRTEDRGQLIMACGTGKTLVSQRIAERTATDGRDIILYATPSIALTAQSRRAWLMNAKRPLRTLVICSDKDAGRNEEGDKDVSSTEIEAPTTTDPADIANEIKRVRDGLPTGGMLAIFATYQSLGRLCEAQANHGAPEVDFAIADEAHRTAQDRYDRSKPRPFQNIHHKLQAKRRLYQTATPRIFSSRAKIKIDKATADVSRKSLTKITDMTDTSVFGPEFHRLRFAEALAADKPRLCDYRIVVLGIPPDALPPDMGEADNDASKPASLFSTSLEQRVCGLAAAMQNKRASDGGELGVGNGGLGNVRSCIAFLNRVNKAGRAAKLLNDPRLAEWGRQRTVDWEWVDEGEDADAVSSGSLSGEDNAAIRNRELRRLRNAAPNNKHVTANVHVLSEGVDVPALDAICFLEPRKNEVDIVQAVGRVMRRPPEGGKPFGYIIVPVIMPRQQSLDLALNKSAEDELAASPDKDEWKVLGQVLAALRSHDERIKTDLASLIIATGTNPPKKCAKCKGKRRIGCEPCKGKAGNQDCVECKGEGHVDCPQCTGDVQDFWDRLADGQFKDVMPVLAGLSGLHDRAEQVQNLIRNAVNNGANALGQEQGLAGTLMPIVGLADASKGDVARRTHIMASLTLMNAMLVHQRITETDADVGIRPLAELQADPKICTATREAWRTVRKHDYQPIFEPALRIMDAAMPGKAAPAGLKTALQGLAAHAEECASEYAEMGMDHAGSLFNAAMDQAQSDGAYYTHPPGAQLLAELACDLYADEDDPMWAKPSTWREVAVMDPACGSGTLLAAFAQSVRRRAKAQNAPDGRLAKAHKELIEQGMIGLDINPQAVQIAAAQLVMGGLTAAFRNMGIWTMPRGRVDNAKGRAPGPDDVRIGSLELLQGSEATGDANSLSEVLDEASRANFERKGAQLAGSQAAAPSKDVLDKRLERVGIVLTNPPFSAMKNAASDLEQPVRAAMQMRLKEIKAAVADRHPEHDAVLQADSMRPPFSFLVSERLDRKRGVLGKIVPTTACNSSALASVQERRLFASEFEVVRIITLHDPKRLAWSVKGHQESLLLMRRKRKGQRSKSVEFVSLRHFPADAEAAMELRRRILAGDMGDLGCICEWPRERFEDGEWWPALFHEPKLAHVCADIQNRCASSRLFAKLGDLCDIEATGRLLRSNANWTWCDDASDGEVDVCRATANEAQQHIAGVVDGWSKRSDRRRNDDGLLAGMRSKSGRLLLANTQDSRSGRVHAVALRNPVAGNAYTPVQGVSWQDAKALAVWLNATPCRILWRANGARRITWPQFSVEAMNLMPIPDLTHHRWRTSRQPLLDAFDATKRMKVPQFRGGPCEIRGIWDDASAKVLGVSRGKVRKWAELLAAEPATAGNRQVETQPD